MSNASGTPSPFDDSPSSLALNTHFLLHPEPEHDDQGSASDLAFSDGDTASQRSIALSSPTHSPRPPPHLGLEDEDEAEVTPSAITPVSYIRQSLSYSKRSTLDTEFSSDIDDERSVFTRRMDDGDSPISSVAPSVMEEREKPMSPPPVLSAVASPPSTARPPVVVRGKSDTDSVLSAGSEGTSYSKKARPESLLPQANQGPLVLGIALVDFDHLVCVSNASSRSHPQCRVRWAPR